MKGRPRLSDAEKKLKGTLQKCRINNAVPRTDTPDEVKPTVALKGLGKKIWERNINFLKKNDLFGLVDIELLTAYCTEMSDYWELSRKADKIERDNDKMLKDFKDTDPDVESLIDFISKMPKPDRWRRMAGNAFDRALKVSDRYGFSPLMRQKLQVTKDQEPEDIMNRFLNPVFKSEVATA
jgi:phage terminase small subunit